MLLPLLPELLVSVSSKSPLLLVIQQPMVMLPLMVLIMLLVLGTLSSILLLVLTSKLMVTLWISLPLTTITPHPPKLLMILLWMATTDSTCGMVSGGVLLMRITPSQLSPIKMIHTGKLVLKPMKIKSTESSELVVLNSLLFFMMVLPTLLELLLLSTPLLLMKIMKTMLLFNLILTLSLINGPLMKTTLLVMPPPLMASPELLSNFWKLMLPLLVLLTMMLVPW
mmetsp:Transcript_28137/g.24880  ORF Transcript_28137/g.24880 Transcript_28137/m.24880 type:complete len:225 (-) Transcript_28137:369-1043(-)